MVSIRRNAGDLRVSQTQQQKDVDSASVSMNQVISGKSAPAATSIYRATHPDADATTSVAHTGEAKRSIYEGETPQEEAARDYRRYSYIRRLIKERKEAEAAAAKAAADSGEFKAGIGSVYRKTGATSFARRFKSYLKQNRATFKNISKEDAEKLTAIVEGRLGMKRTGSEINRKDRLKMRHEAFQAYKRGELSRDDYRDFEKFIGQLD